MNAPDHAFYLTLAYGLSGLLLAAEVLLLWGRSRRARALQQGDPS